MLNGVTRKRVILIPKPSSELDSSPKVFTMFDWFKHENKNKTRYIIPDWDCTHFWQLVEKNSIKIKKEMMIYIPVCLSQSRSLWRTSGNTTATTCAADAHKYIAKILCKPQRAQHTPKMLNHLSFGFLQPCCMREQQHICNGHRKHTACRR